MYTPEDIGSGVANNGDVYLSAAVYAEQNSGQMSYREFAYKVTECTRIEEVCFNDWSASEETSYLVFDTDKQRFVNYYG